MKKTTLLLSSKLNPTLVFLLLLFFVAPIQMIAQTQIAPQVNFLQRTSSATPTKTIYNVKGDFTMLGNTNLTLVNYNNSTDNETNTMKYIDIDGDANTWNSSMATLELSNSGENSAIQNCSTILFAGLYWTGKSDDADTFVVSKQVPNGTQAINNNLTVNHSQAIANTNYSLNITKNGGGGNTNPIYTFSGNGNTYAFNYTNNAAPATVTLSVNGGAATNIPVTITISGTTATATLTTPYVIADGTVNLTIKQLIRSTATNLNSPDTQSASSAAVNVSGTIPAFATITKNYDKKVVSLKGPGATTYETITANSNGINSEIRFPGTAQSGIYVGYQEITDYVKTHGPGAYTVADIALKEGSNANPGLSGGWVIVVIYENPLMKSRAVTLFDGYDYINGQAVGGEYGLIPISGFTTVGSGPVSMKLGVIASEGDVALSGDYLAVQKLNQDPAVYPGNYLVLNHSGNSTTNFFNSSIFPQPAAGSSNPILQNNTGVDFSMFTIPNATNSVIANNQTATTFRFGSTSDVFTIFGFAMSVDAYVPEPNGLISVTSINNVTNPAVLNVLPGQTINYSINFTNEGTEATNNTIISIPIPATAIFNTGATISYHTYHGFTTANVPYFDSVTNHIIWNLGTLPITAGHPEYIYADLSFTLNVTTDCAIILSAGCSPEVSLETGTITGTGAISGASFTQYFFQGYDATVCHLPIDGSIKVAIDPSSCFSSIAGPDKMAYCGGESVTLDAAAGTAGSWDIVSGPAGGGETFSDITSPSSTFYSPNLGAYTLRWSTSCATTDNVVITFSLCNVVNFDGIDDNINFKNNFNLNSGNFSIEAWVKSNATNGDTQTIVSKHLSPSSTDGYDLRLVNDLISFNWNNNSIIATHPIGTNRWYHIAVTFDGTNYKLYIDGILDNTAASALNPTSNSVDFILGAMSQNTDTPYNYYNGYADELRMWNVSLTANQIRQMMNQEITNDGSGNVIGVIIPKNISGLSWTNLTGYYQMNRTSDVENGYLVDKSGNLIYGKLKGINIPQPDTAPMPYISLANGSWETDETWINYPVWDVPNSIGVDGLTKIDWNIVKTLHDITSNGNKTVLGLLVNSNKLSAENNSKIEVSSYLKLDGKIDLVGMSQLVQTTESDLDPTSSGSIERDQQGQSNLYNYNYWSSPVGPINAVTNNNNYTVGNVLKDGTNPVNPLNINWIGGYNGLPGTPISLARYWIFKFQNVSNAYANWSQVFETGTLAPAQGFTLKGSGAASGKQNYTFIGKPFNGTITSPVAANNLNLSGNPYASAIDANQFIDDNVSSLAGAYTTTGTIYYWEHSSSNNTHNLAAYQGGYAAYTKTGGTPPIAPSGINGLGGNTKIAKRFIPVGQSFFVVGSPTGGNIVFNNAQRLFVKEDDVEAFPLFRTSNNMLSTENNDNDAYEADTFSKVRLGFNSSNNYHRQILLGFMNQNASSSYDVGYDAIHIDNQPNDMYFMAETTKLTIQGVGSFNKNRIYPLEIKTAVEGNVQFVLDSLENFNANQQIYVYDEVTDIYHNITEQLFEVLLPAGIAKNRFYLCFKNKKGKNNNNKNTLDEGDLHDEMQVMYTDSNHVLNIMNFSDDKVNTVSLFNIMGQFISKWVINNKEQTNIQIPIQNISSGTYIVKIKTTEGEISKKIIVK